MKNTTAIGISITAWVLAIVCVVAILGFGIPTVTVSETTLWEKVELPQYEEITIPEIVFEEEPAQQFVIDVTPNEIDLMARVVMSESSTLSECGKQAVAQTIVNRVISEEFPNTVTDVINQPNAYSTAFNGNVTLECYNAVYQALENPVFAENMVYICSNGYHSYGYPYLQIGGMFFNTLEDMTTYREGTEIQY